MTDERIRVSPAAVYAAGLRSGRLRYQRCEGCGSAVFYPRVMSCPHCGADRLIWQDSAGRGTVYSTTTTRSRSGDRNVALIDLGEGFRMMCTVRDECDHDVQIGDIVFAVVPQGTTAESLFFERRPER